MLPRKSSSYPAWARLKEMNQMKMMEKMKKIEKKKHSEVIEEKENIQDLGNNQSTAMRVDVTKKIKKRPCKKNENIRPISLEPINEEINGFIVYPEHLLGFNIEFASLIRPQRIDNDVDTDQEQIKLGVKRLHRSLEQSVEAQILIQKEENSNLIQNEDIKPNDS